MRKVPKLDEPLPLNSFVIRRNFKTVQFLDKLKTVRVVLFKIVNKATEV